MKDIDDRDRIRQTCTAFNTLLPEMAHEGGNGHWGKVTTLRLDQKSFSWEGLKKMSRTFATHSYNLSILTLESESQDHIDTIGPLQSQLNPYILILGQCSKQAQDRGACYSSKTICVHTSGSVHTKSLKANSVVNAIMHCIAEFGVANKWIWDGASHVKNEVMKYMPKK